GAAGVRGDASDQCVSGLADKRDVDHPTITNAEESGRQTAGERRDLPGFAINAPDPAFQVLGDVERTIGTDGAALGTSQAARQQGGGRRRGRWPGGPSRRRDHGDQGRSQQYHAGLDFGCELVLHFLPFVTAFSGLRLSIWLVSFA